MSRQNPSLLLYSVPIEKLMGLDSPVLRVTRARSDCQRLIDKMLEGRSAANVIVARVMSRSSKYAAYVLKSLSTHEVTVSPRTIAASSYA